MDLPAHPGVLTAALVATDWTSDPLGGELVLCVTPCEFAHGLLSARRAFDRGVGCGYVGHTWALWSRSQKGEGLPTGKRVSL